MDDITLSTKLLASAVADAQRSGGSCPHMWEEVEQLAATIIVQARAKRWPDLKRPMMDEATCTQGV